MKKVRFQFELPKENSDRLDELAEQVGVTKREIINNALTLFDWAVEEVKAGKTIASVDEEEKRFKELLLPLLGAFSVVGRANRERDMSGSNTPVSPPTGGGR
jgi:predicted DNA-binding protein